MYELNPMHPKDAADLQAAQATPGQVLSADEIVDGAVRRYQYDVEFHARVKRAVMVVEAHGVINSREAKNAATYAAAVTVWLAEQEKTVA